MAKAVICAPNSIWLITYQWPAETVSKTVFSSLGPIGFYMRCETESERRGLFGRGGTGKAEGRWEGGKMCPTARHSWAVTELSIAVSFWSRWMVEGRWESQRKRLDTASILNPKKVLGSLWRVWGCGKATVWKSELQHRQFQCPFRSLEKCKGMGDLPVVSFRLHPRSGFPFASKGKLQEVRRLV